MSHIVNPTAQEGSKTKNLVSDDNVQDLLSQILKELRIMNIHLSLISDVNISGEQVETI